MKRSLNHQRVYRILAIVVLILALTVSGVAAETLTQVQAAIEAQGARWVAGETSVSKLTLAQKQKRLGLMKETFSGQGKMLAVPETAVILPSSLDWRANGGNYVTPVRDQGSCGSCWAFAAAGALESYVLRKEGKPGTNDNRAEQILVSCCNEFSKGCRGGYVSEAADFLQDTGLPPETYFPYTATTNVCTAAVGGWENYTYPIYSWSWVCTYPGSVSAIKNALYTYGPLVTTMDVYDDFYAYRSGVYQFTTGAGVGGHAVLIVGYVDNESVPGGGYFIVKNSWGTGWGMSGYFNIAYSQINYPVYFGEWTIAFHSPVSSTPTAPNNLTATNVSGSQIDLSWTDNSNNEQGFEVESCEGPGCTNFVKIATLGANIATYSNTGLTAGISYSYRVRAYNSDGSSTYSNTATATVFSNDSGIFRMIWTHTSGQVSIWRLDASDNLVGYRNYGPYSGWTAKYYHRNSDGTGKLIWANTSGQVSIWTMDVWDNRIKSSDHGPYSGWTAIAYDENADGSGRLIWAHTSGQVSIWRLDSSDNRIGYSNHGPYSGWAAKLYNSNTDGTAKLLWEHTTGWVSHWQLDSLDKHVAYNNYGPYSGWRAKLYHNNADGTGRLLWEHTTGWISHWKLDSSGNHVGYNNYGPYDGWRAKFYHRYADGTERLLWEHTTGWVSHWRLDSSGNLVRYSNYGPFDGWTPIAYE